MDLQAGGSGAHDGGRASGGQSAEVERTPGLRWSMQKMKSLIGEAGYRLSGLQRVPQESTQPERAPKDRITSWWASMARVFPSGAAHRNEVCEPLESSLKADVQSTSPPFTRIPRAPASTGKLPNLSGIPARPVVPSRREPPAEAPSRHLKSPEEYWSPKAPSTNGTPWGARGQPTTSSTTRRGAARTGHQAQSVGTTKSPASKPTPSSRRTLAFEGTASEGAKTTARRGWGVAAPGSGFSLVRDSKRAAAARLSSSQVQQALQPEGEHNLSAPVGTGGQRGGGATLEGAQQKAGAPGEEAASKETQDASQGNKAIKDVNGGNAEKAAGAARSEAAMGEGAGEAEGAGETRKVTVATENMAQEARDVNDPEKLAKKTPEAHKVALKTADAKKPAESYVAPVRCAIIHQTTNALSPKQQSSVSTISEGLVSEGAFEKAVTRCKQLQWVYLRLMETQEVLIILSQERDAARKEAEEVTAKLGTINALEAQLAELQAGKAVVEEKFKGLGAEKDEADRLVRVAQQAAADMRTTVSDLREQQKALNEQLLTAVQNKNETVRALTAAEAQIQTLTAAQAELTKEHKSVEEQLNAVNEQLLLSTQEKNALVRARTVSDARIEELTVSEAEAKQQLESITGQLSEAAAEKTSLGEKLTQIQGEKEGVEKRLSQLATEKAEGEAQLGAEISQLQVKVEGLNLKADELEKKLGSHMERLGALTAEKEAAEKRSAELLSVVEEKEGMVSELQGQVVKLKGDLTAMAKAKHVLAEQVAQQRCEAEAAEEGRLTAEAALREVSKEVQTAKGEIETLKEELSHAKLEATKLLHRVNSLEDDTKHLNGSLAGEKDARATAEQSVEANRKLLAEAKASLERQVMEAQADRDTAMTYQKQQVLGLQEKLGEAEGRVRGLEAQVGTAKQAAAAAKANALFAVELAEADRNVLQEELAKRGDEANRLRGAQQVAEEALMRMGAERERERTEGEREGTEREEELEQLKNEVAKLEEEVGVLEEERGGWETERARWSEELVKVRAKTREMEGTIRKVGRGESQKGVGKPKVEKSMSMTTNAGRGGQNELSGLDPPELLTRALDYQRRVAELEKQQGRDAEELFQAAVAQKRLTLEVGQLRAVLQETKDKVSRAEQLERAAGGQTWNETPAGVTDRIGSPPPRLAANDALHTIVHLPLEDVPASRPTHLPTSPPSARLPDSQPKGDVFQEYKLPPMSASGSDDGAPLSGRATTQPPSRAAPKLYAPPESQPTPLSHPRSPPPPMVETAYAEHAPAPNARRGETAYDLMFGGYSGWTSASAESTPNADLKAGTSEFALLNDAPSTSSKRGSARRLFPDLRSEGSPQQRLPPATDPPGVDSPTTVLPHTLEQSFGSPSRSSMGAKSFVK